MDCDPAKRITVIIISASDGQSYPIKQTVILPKEEIIVIIISASNKATPSNRLWSCQKKK